MEFFELMDISHKYLDILNPSSQEKMLAVGDVLNLNAGSRVIDFGSGKGELLALWAEKFGISGTGVDISKKFYETARKKLQERTNRCRGQRQNGQKYRGECGTKFHASGLWKNHPEKHPICRP